MDHILTVAADALDPRGLPRYDICRATGPLTIDGKLGKPDWQAAQSVGDFVFPWWESGDRDQTVAKMLWDDENLYVAFACRETYISAQVTDHDGPVSEDSCVEVFTSPDPDCLDRYFNFEFNAWGTYLDARPGAKERDYAWNAEGVRVGITIDGTLNDDTDRDHGWTAEIAIPFTNFAGFAKHAPPQAGDYWRLNLTRCHSHANRQYSQWAPSPTPAPQFHAPEGFGIVRFVNARVR